MYCPKCGQPLQINVCEDKVEKIIMAEIECPACEAIDIIITWLEGKKGAVIVASSDGVFAMN